MKLRVYIDTSVIGGCLDEEFKEASNSLIQRFKEGEMTAIVSELTQSELQQAPPRIMKIVNEIPELHLEYVELTQEASELAKEYISERIITENHLVDAQHIAIATVERADIVVSWNFKDIVNVPKIRGFNAINLKMGYPMLEIRSPWEVI